MSNRRPADGRRGSVVEYAPICYPSTILEICRSVASHRECCLSHLGDGMDAFSWLSLVALIFSFVALILAIRSGSLEINQRPE
jgi:hypothetical protein